MTSRKEIDNVFGGFYSKLYDEEKDDNEECDHCTTERNKRWRRQESEDKKNENLQSSHNMRCRLQIDKLRKGSDSNGIRAEDSKRVVKRRKK